MMEQMKSSYTEPKTRIIINPISGTTEFSKKERMAEQAGQRLEELGYNVLDPVITEWSGHETVLAEEAIKENVNLLFYLGGDGTAQKMLGPLINKGSMKKDMGNKEEVIGYTKEDVPNDRIISKSYRVGRTMVYQRSYL